MMDSAIQLYLWIILAMAVVFGLAAQFSRFCLVGALAEIQRNRQWQRLGVYVAAMGFAVLATMLAQAITGVDLNQTKPPYRTPDFAWGRYLLGGFLFGVGMVLARGCPVRSLVKVTQGNLQALLAIGVMAITAYAMTRTELYATVFAPWVQHLSVSLTQFGIAHQDLGSLFGIADDDRIIALVLGAVLLLLALRWLPFTTHRLEWLGALLIGSVIGLAFAVTGGNLGQAAQSASEMANDPQQGLGTQSFTFSAPLGDVVYFLQHPTHNADLTFGVLAVGGLLLGSLVSVALRREWRWVVPRGGREWGRTIIGATLVGVGSVLAMGCTVGHGLSGIATLAVGSMLALAAIVVGAWVALRIESRTQSPTICG